MNTLTKTTLIAAALFTSFTAQSVELLLGTGSYHLSKHSHHHLNECNPSIGISVENFSVIYVRKNSWGNPSVYATYSPEYKFNDSIKIKGQLGFATNYHTDDVYKNFHNEGNGSRTGLAPIVGATIQVNPFGSDYGISTTITPVALMFNLSIKMF